MGRKVNNEFNRLTSRRAARAARDLALVEAEAAKDAEDAKEPIGPRPSLRTLINDLHREGQILAGRPVQPSTLSIRFRPRLTEHQKIVVRLWSAGRSTSHIARDLKMSVDAVGATFRRIKERHGFADWHEIRGFGRSHFEQIHPAGCSCPTIYCTAVRLAAA